MRPPRSGLATALALTLVAAGCGGKAEPRPKLPARLAHARELFVRHCGSCHALRDAGTNGVVGKSLDDTRPSHAVVLRTLAKPPQNMPAALVTGADAQAVADYVAAVAGR